MQTTTRLELDTATTPARGRAELLRASLLETFGPMHVECLPQAQPSAVIRSTRRGEIDIHAMRYSGLSLARRPADLARLRDEYFTLTLPASNLPVVQTGEDRTLQAGQIYLVNHAVPYRTNAHTEYRTNSIAFPARLLRERLGPLRPFYDVAACSASPGATELVRAFATHLSQGAGSWSDHEFQTLVDQLLDMLALFLKDKAGSAWSAPESCTRAGHLQRALQAIQAEACVPGFGPAEVAAACGISLSYLHDVFRAAEMSVEECIFDERLRVARRLLTDPRRRGTPIQTLCYEAGFSDPAHFSRKFRARFGLTPGELRRGAGASPEHQGLPLDSTPI